MDLSPFRVFPRFLDKVWGAHELGPWFPDTPTKTGEAWFTDSRNQTSLSSPSGTPLSLGDAVQLFGSRLLGSAIHGTQFPLLVKFLFTSEKLSVQVHPDDLWAGEHEQSLGKTEMWHVLKAAPGAAVAVGLRERSSKESVRQAALDGSIEQLLQWWPVQAGDSIYIPAGAIHAIGSGLTLCEIQQSSDITYRLYDYGRPRELHLEESLAVATLGPHPGLCQPCPLGHGRTLLASGPYFRTERIVLQAGAALTLRPNSRRFEVWIVVSGEGACNELPMRAGDVLIVPASGAMSSLGANSTLELLHTVPPA